MAYIIQQRENWLAHTARLLASEYAALGAPITHYRVSCGFPSVGESRRVIGECWNESCSSDGMNEIFINPSQSDSLQVAAILAHELCHAAVGIAAGHGPVFGKLARAIGLEGHLTATVPGEAFKTKVSSIIAEIGEYPHGALAGHAVPIPVPGDPEAKPEPRSTRPKSQTGRMLKAACSCGYTIRVSRKWADAGMPTCPCGGSFVLDPKGM